MKIINKFKFILKQKIQHWLGITTLTKEVHSNFIQANALEEYIEREKGIKEFVDIQCEKHGIVDPDAIKQLMKNQGIKNFLEYNNKILPESMKELLIKLEGEDISYGS